MKNYQLLVPASTPCSLLLIFETFDPHGGHCVDTSLLECDAV